MRVRLPAVSWHGLNKEENIKIGIIYILTAGLTALLIGCNMTGKRSKGNIDRLIINVPNDSVGLMPFGWQPNHKLNVDN